MSIILTSILLFRPVWELCPDNYVMEIRDVQRAVVFVYVVDTTSDPCEYSSKDDARYSVNICSEVLFLFESQCLQPTTQEVRAADDNVVAPANLHLPADVEV